MLKKEIEDTNNKYIQEYNTLFPTQDSRKMMFFYKVWRNLFKSCDVQVDKLDNFDKSAKILYDKINK
jgi:hypothetical protein